ncbi:MAG: helix-turn-helix transcriptional regulator [Clostridia bacterium]|nr:helix-turn-helix transcriptional regulator [Clostridia bacterium]
MRKERVTFISRNRPVRIQTESYEKDFLVSMHFHTELEILRVDSGMMRCYANNDICILKEGDIILFNSMLPHATEILIDQSSTSFVQFKNPASLPGTLHYLSHFLKKSGSPYYVFDKNDPVYEELNNCISTIVAENKKNSISHDYVITANLYLILSILHRKKLLPDMDRLIDASAIRKIMPVLDFIEENYNDNLSLSQLSDILNLNENYFCRIFKKATGTTVTEYLNFVRVYEAQKLLSGQMSLSEISNQVGFASLSYFNRVFKRYYLCSPSAYKKISGQADNFLL